MESRTSKKAKRFNLVNKTDTSADASNRSMGDRILIEKGDDGSQQLYVELATAEGDLHRLDITSWLNFPDLYPAIADGAFSAVAGSRFRTRQFRFQALTRGFFAFLKSVPDSHRYCLEDINTFLVNQFIKWLDQSDDSGGARWSVKSRDIMLAALSSTTNALKRDPKWSAQLNGLIIRKKVWPQIERSSEPTKTLSGDDWDRLFRACVREMQDTIETVERGKSLIAANITRIPKQPYKASALKDLGIFLATVKSVYPGVIPYKRRLREENLPICTALAKYHPLRSITTYLYPSASELVPFAIMLAMKTSGNTTQILGACLSDFEEREVLGVRRLVWRKFKDRSATTQMRSIPISDDIDNPHRFINFIRDWTAGIRTEAAQPIRDHLFLFGPSGGTPKANQDRKPTSFYEPGKSLSSVAWHIELKKFLDRNNLPDLAIQSIRMTGIDRADVFFGGDIRAKAAIGGQRSIDVIANHYFSGATKARNEERIGALIETHNRYRDTKGKSDPRIADPGADIGCATPGFQCLDPFSSPVPGQQAGRLCTAYGSCPDCPLAQVNISSSYSLGRLLQLRTEIINAQGYLDTARWIACWSPRLLALNTKWLPRFTKQAADGLENLQINPIPPIE